MSDDVIYKQLARPSGILRVLLGMLALISAASLWNAQNAQEWLTVMLSFVTWAIPATLMWLLLILITFSLFQIPFVKNAWICSNHQGAQLIRRFWPTLLGAICAGGSAWLGNLDFPSFYITSYWSWPEAVWGALIATIIAEWFYRHGQGQTPADTQAKLMELQARIRPHFLFNTLNSAIALVRLDPDAAESVLQNLAVLFRTALESGESSATTLHEEVELAKKYLSIESVRLGERLQIVWRLDDKTLGGNVPMLSLQPIVENAVRHGVEPSPEGGQIVIASSQHMGKIRLTVSNTMLSPDAQSHSTKGHGMALANLHARISLMHDFEGILKTQSTQDTTGQHWFVTTLEVPAS